jgi:hypothetical protein
MWRKPKHAASGRHPANDQQPWDATYYSTTIQPSTAIQPTGSAEPGHLQLRSIGTCLGGPPSC